ncbi:malto-oligosyltrehalose synthase [Pseudactinotalea sp. Z1739]|uniref:malto-oligosyltrehalose synthase n=1 Tax=Pseudactinotalea sp. Z1739 TaxID=3413028 RepID=UPI003C7E7E52
MPRTPINTYRLQLGPDLSFDAAAARIDYLSSLGVTDLYLSPILTAAPGSTHGYDVVDHSRISPALGGRNGLERLVAAARAREMGIVVDVVPNHMAAPTPASENAALWSMLTYGPDSDYAEWFDVDWAEDGQVLMPVLGRRLGAAMAAGELTVAHVDEPEHGLDGTNPVLCYYEHRFPLRPGTEHLPLAELLERQHYRLAYWRVADEELNYRRFFDVGTLLAVRVERPAVFEATHALLLELIEQGLIDGLRIDHPDGLADPREYFRRLHEATGGRWSVAEKILEPHETIPADWPTAGTTGYDASWRIGQVLIDPAGSAPLGALMHELTGDTLGLLPELVADAKREILTTSLRAEVGRLAGVISEICHDDVRLRDHTRAAITDCLTELVVAADRYRAYVVPGEPAPAAAQAVVAQWAEQAAARLSPERLETLDVVTDLVLGRETGSAGRRHEARRGEVITRFQQVCGAVTAKGVEDTAFYRWTHLTSLCEVGGAPGTFSVGSDELHAWAGAIQTARPASMTAGSTHDNKRGEDVRARIGVISEHAEAWIHLVHQLREVTAPVRPDLHGRTENLTWQTLAGTWTDKGPINASRLGDYLIKAAREAKAWTTWTSVDAEGEQALADFAEHLVTDPAVHELMQAWVARTTESVRVATLATKALQLTVPGVADVYQGSETTRVALVDPDNRGPVDHHALTEMLARLDSGAGPSGPAEEKLRLVAAVLRLRRRRPEVFVGARAGYQPLATSTGHAIAFARSADEQPQAVTIATRLPVALGRLGGWGEHTVVLPPGHWHDVISGAEHPGGAQPVSEVLRHGPVAVLEVADRTADQEES